ncbi:hypothetical protein [Nonlabens marinus]|uniref:Uncharacterized protein n=1 Tax=Nonlabens marinus S1-08 TaxID=1454201 RepID=W8VSP2_9FLAO|nr:hypothetical protein [Nonlabens marinus]BAO56380.1 hypothetical protein NMS_2371 [Nonlabens marinus S1-08]
MRILSTLLLCAVLFTACSVEENSEPIPQQIDFNINSSAFGAKSTSPTAVLCQSTDLIAGQTEVVGTVEVYVDGTVVSIVYTTIPGWNLDETHMSVGNCTGDIPTTGSGNPKVGHFEYSANHSDGTTVVTYTADSTNLPAETCVAAHAVVSSTAGANETAWGHGPGFPGRSWATFMQIDMTACGGSTPPPPVDER